MTPREVWDSLTPQEQAAAISDRLPRAGVVFRCLKSGRTKTRYIEAQEGESWRTVTLAPKTLRYYEREQD